MRRRVLISLAIVVLAVILTTSWFVSDVDGRAAPIGTAAVRADLQAETQPNADMLVEDVRALEMPRVAAHPSATTDALQVRVVGPDGSASDTWWVEVHTESELPRVVGERGTYPRRRSALAMLRGSGAETAELLPALRKRHARLVLVGKALQMADSYYVESDEFVVDATTRSPIVLVAAPSTIVSIVVEGPRPSGDLRYEIMPVGAVPSPGTRGPDFVVTAGSDMDFAVTPNIAHRVRVTGTNADDVVETLAPAVERGERVDVVLRFPGGLASPAPEGYAELALSGSVVGDGCGNPGLWATIDGGSPITIPVRKDGRFDLVAIRGSEVELHAAGGDLEAGFEPEVSKYSFGARDIVVTCRAPAPRVDVRFRLLAAESNEPLADVWIAVERLDGERVRSRVLGALNSAELTVALPALEDLDYFVCARGRRDERARLFSAGVPVAGAVVERTVRLERGFRRDFRVLHCSQHTPVVAASFVHAGQFLGVTDGEGRVRIELEEWPDRIEVEATGFDPGQWPPSFQSPLTLRTVMLCPLD